MLTHKHRSERGTAVTLGLVLSIVITGLVAAIAWVAGAQANMVGSLDKTDGAFCAAEAGLQRVQWSLRYNANTYHSGSSLLSPFSAAMTGSCDTYSYSATCSLNSDYSLRVTSVGSVGTISYTLSTTLYPPVQGIPTFSSAGDWDNKNVTVVGDVQTKGSFTNSGGSGSVTGNVFYGGTATGTSAVTGVARYVDPSSTTDPNAFASLNWPVVEATLDAVVTSEGTSAALNGNQSNVTFDFTKLSGTDKVYKVVGNVTNPTFIGSGTLYINGSLQFTNNTTMGSSSSPVNIVTVGSVANITFDKKAIVYGSLYAEGDWDRAQTDVYGMVYVEGIARSDNGSSTLDSTGITVPFFDTRAPAGSAVTSPIRIANFTGPQP